jgi:threonyl-tRNA synthetase
VGNKIRKAVNEKVPYMLVIGDKEIKSDPSTSSGKVKLAVRDRGSDKVRQVNKDKFISEIKKQIKVRV